MEENHVKILQKEKNTILNRMVFSFSALSPPKYQISVFLLYFFIKIWYNKLEAFLFYADIMTTTEKVEV